MGRSRNFGWESGHEYSCTMQADEDREAAEEQRILDEAEAIVRRKKDKLEKLRAAAAGSTDEDEDADQRHDEL
jgi:hypothetical protein